MQQSKKLRETPKPNKASQTLNQSINTQQYRHQPNKRDTRTQQHEIKAKKKRKKCLGI